ncbi:16S rRNA (guanine(527)-N(7))-methyltransferase RsmG [Actinoalloteichus caeruleus]|uniref:Ribosomal RNA small subunit methyltransferase G n=1 Tax=Actinoalloteichus caeruleus DSM 43889 TaxID=1120930 RepID=A0ABT1JKE9_ACTCY|nr:16S rRNA (guanine(527)-N(7))-methyltransferase RsmG [Actinoalloteichus caeruleus]MCP2332977.1 16S rRNA (guanine527-N7)-methyltransferase [Actinoalloteichus caeruleus DSM 43889]
MTERQPPPAGELGRGADDVVLPPASEEEPPAAADLFGDHLPRARRLVDLLVEHGERRGLVGPRELGRLWSRHVLNSAAVQELVPVGSRLIDVGSGAGLPGLPLAIARPDIRMTLLEPMARRVAWLEEAVEVLGLDVAVVRGRAEERQVRSELGGADVVTARAVAPLAKLGTWCLPLLRPGGQLLALKGASAEEEVERDAAALSRAGGSRAHVVRCGAESLAEPTTVVVVERGQAAPPSRRAPARGRRTGR